MLAALLKPTRQIVELFLGHESSQQIAAGAAIGAVAGLVPKDNLIALSLAVLLFSIRVNRSAGLLAMGLFAAVGPWFDPFLHRLGSRLLAAENLQPTYVWLYEQPLGPWIGFNNTVVLGALVVGLYIAYPVYAISEISVARCRKPVAAWLARRRATRWLAGADAASRLGPATAILPAGVGDAS